MDSAKAVGLFGRVRRATGARLGDSGRSMSWAALTQLAGTFIRFGSSLTLTHFLAPEVYGLIGAVLAVQMVIELAADLGIRPAIVSNPRGGDPAFLATAWSMLLARSLIVGAAILCASAVLPGWLEQPTIGPLIAVMALRPVIQALANPSVMLLYRRMQYRQIGVIELGQTFVGVAATLALVIFGDLRSPWAFVGGIFAGDLAQLLISYAVAPRPPRPAWHRPAARDSRYTGLSA